MNIKTYVHLHEGTGALQAVPLQVINFSPINLSAGAQLNSITAPP